MSWIGVHEEMPLPGQAILVYQTWPPETMFNLLAFPLCRCWYYVAEYDGRDFRERGTQPRTFAHISHWMHLPDKPR